MEFVRVTKETCLFFQRLFANTSSHDEVAGAESRNASDIGNTPRAIVGSPLMEVGNDGGGGNVEMLTDIAAVLPFVDASSASLLMLLHTMLPLSLNGPGSKAGQQTRTFISLSWLYLVFCELVVPFLLVDSLGRRRQCTDYGCIMATWEHKIAAIQRSDSCHLAHHCNIHLHCSMCLIEQPLPG